jgi:hypothetical protein
MEQFLKKALEPVGTTMYIWGGGWNKTDDGAGMDGQRIGLNPRWKQFFLKQDASYNWKEYRYCHGLGLDCSGYIGWVLYNVLAPAGYEGDYVAKAGWQPQMLARRGFGAWKPSVQVTDWKRGDLMGSMEQGHIFLVLELCQDGSLLICHSSPPGVQVSATVNSQGEQDSQAAALAERYMKGHHPKWWKRYGILIKGKDYLTKYDQFRFFCDFITDDGKNVVLYYGYREKKLISEHEKRYFRRKQKCQ